MSDEDNAEIGDVYETVIEIWPGLKSSKFRFKKPLFHKSQSETNMFVPIVRSGDLRRRQSLRYNATSEVETVLAEPTTGVIMQTIKNELFIIVNKFRFN